MLELCIFLFKPKKNLVLVIFLIWFPVMSYAQMLRTPPGDSLEIAFSKTERITAIGGSLGFATGPKSQFFLGAGLGFFDGFIPDIPPAPIIGIGMLAIRPVGKSGVNLFGAWSLGGSRLEMIHRGQTIYSTTSLMLSPGIGIFKEFETSSGLTIRPLAEISFNYYLVWDRFSIDGNISKVSDTEENFSGEIGIELDISSTTTLTLSYDFILWDHRLERATSLDSHSWFGIALNFH